MDTESEVALEAALGAPANLRQLRARIAEQTIKPNDFVTTSNKVIIGVSCVEIVKRWPTFEENPFADSKEHMIETEVKHFVPVFERLRDRSKYVPHVGKKQLTKQLLRRAA